MLSNRIYTKERRPQYKSDKNKRSALTPNCKKIANTEKILKYENQKAPRRFLIFVL